MTGPSRRPWIGTSWKMNKTRREASDYLAGLSGWALTTGTDATVVVFPPFTALADAAAALDTSAGQAVQAEGRPERGPCIQLGAQNMHWQPSGALTGEISPAMLLDAGVSSVELGHFERRQHFGETDEAVNLKARSALACGLEPVICVGDSTGDRHYGVAAEAVARQVKIALHGLGSGSLPRVVLAYEPGWAIGTDGENAGPDEVESMHSVIRSAVAESHGLAASQDVRVVYGGSVQVSNARSYAESDGIDGLFVGRAALDLANFLTIIEQFCAVRQRDPNQSLAPEGNLP